MEKLTPEAAKQLPTHPENVAMQYQYNAVWLSKNQAAITERWTAWLLT